MAQSVTKFHIEAQPRALPALAIGELRESNRVDVVVRPDGPAPLYALGTVRRDQDGFVVEVDPPSVPDDAEEATAVEYAVGAHAYVPLDEKVRGVLVDR